LITNGASDSLVETREAIQAADNYLWKRATRIAIGIQDYDSQELEAFASTGKVVEVDALDNEANEPVRQKLIFPVADPRGITDIMKAVAVSSLIDSTCKHDNEEPTIIIPDFEVSYCPVRKRL